jgi:hypothetical protein
VTLALGVAWALVPLRAPAPLEADAPATAFSAARALGQLEAIAAAPRAIGSARHAEVRDLLLGQLKGLGLEAEIQRAVSSREERPGLDVAAEVENVVGLLAGSGGGAGVLLVAHYDSVPTGPGAADDGAAVASVLETLRALANGPRPQRDVVVLFSDGEELGMFGARAFVERHPWAGRAGLVLNFEARGSSGPLALFETDEQNAGLMDEVARSGADPLAISVAYEVSRRLPNETDFDVFRAAGARGANFAFSDDYTSYHTWNDTLRHLDPRSVQHQGEVMLALTRHLSSGGGPVPAGGSAIFFNVAPWLIRYPAWWSAPLSVVIAAGVGWMLRRALRSGRMSVRELGAGAAVAVGGAVAAGAVAGGLLPGLDLVFHLEAALPQGVPYDGGLFALGLGLVAGAVLAAAWSWAPRAAPRAIQAAGLCLWCVFGLACAVAAPGASYLFAWPAAFGGAALALGLFELPADPRARALAQSALAVPALLLLLPILYAASVALTLRATFLMVLISALSATLIAPPLLLLVGRGRAVALATAALGALTLGLAVTRAAHDARELRSSSLTYLLDADQKQALWLAEAEELSDWAQASISRDAPRSAPADYLPSEWPVRRAGAEPLELSPPAIEILRDEIQGGSRQVSIRFASTRGAPMVELQVEPFQAVLGGSFANQKLSRLTATLTEGSADRVFRFWGVNPSGATVELALDASARVQVRALDLGFELPTLPSLPPRPPGVMPEPYGFGIPEGTMVTREISLPAAR